MVCWFSVLTLLATATTGRCSPTRIHSPRSINGVPEYVLRHAPVAYLHSTEQFFPTDLQTFLSHTTPQTNHTTLPPSFPPYPQNLTLANLDSIPPTAFLTSTTDPTLSPPASWLLGSKPNSGGRIPDAQTACVVVTATREDGGIDAFYFFFYAWNYGGEVLGWDWLNFGNHVGDWEHIMIRFSAPSESNNAAASATPQAVWFSQHANGQAFKWDTVKKEGDRVVVYVARGSHANYAIPGRHSHVIPNLNLPAGVLEDHTDAGVRWDTTGSSGVLFYSWDRSTGAFEARNGGETAWLGFQGRWGDEALPDDDPRQVVLFGQRKYGSGPSGPRDKELGREKVCPDNGVFCIVRSVLVP